MHKSFIISIILILGLALLTGCGSDTQDTDTTQKTFTLGAVAPLTGDGAAYGLPTQKVIEAAVLDVNKKWADAGKKYMLDLYFEDGKCNPKDGLTAAQNLVNLRGVKVIYGGLCSGETLGLAPFANAQKVIAFSALSSSPDITNAGDYIFRNYPSDTAQVAAVMKKIKKDGPKKIAILSENTDYVQALRRGYKAVFQQEGIQLVGDEVIESSVKDLRTELLKIKSSNPDAVILIPQTIPMGEIMVKQYTESGIEATVYSGEVLGLGEVIDKQGSLMEGFYSVRAKFNENNNEFLKLKARTGCDLGIYCITTYDGIFLLAELFEECGEDTQCLKKNLYDTKNWRGFTGASYSFDSNGDVAGEFEVFQITNGETVVVN